MTARRPRTLADLDRRELKLMAIYRGLGEPGKTAVIRTLLWVRNRKAAPTAGEVRKRFDREHFRAWIRERQAARERGEIA